MQTQRAAGETTSHCAGLAPVSADSHAAIESDHEPMKIASAASAFPKHYYPQKFLLEKLREYWGDRLKNPQTLARLHRNVTVEGRYLAIPAEDYHNLETWGQANDAWIKVAKELGEQALCRALHHAGLEPNS